MQIFAGSSQPVPERELLMKHLRLAILLCAAALAFTTPALAQTVKVNWNQSVNFSQYKTYAWKLGPTQNNSFYTPWVQSNADQQLKQKGLTLAAAGQTPDIYITYHMQTQELMDATTTDDGFGPGWGWGPGPWGAWGGWGGWGVGIGGGDIATTTEQPRTLGILSVDLYDSAKKQLIWRGQATVDNVSNSQSGDEKQTKNSIDKMFKQYPPKSK
jgi:hypothetical protein